MHCDHFQRGNAARRLADMAPRYAFPRLSGVLGSAKKPPAHRGLGLGTPQIRASVWIMGLGTCMDSQHPLRILIEATVERRLTAPHCVPKGSPMGSIAPRLKIIQETDLIQRRTRDHPFSIFLSLGDSDCRSAAFGHSRVSVSKTMFSSDRVIRVQVLVPASRARQGSAEKQDSVPKGVRCIVDFVSIHRHLSTWHNSERNGQSIIFSRCYSYRQSP